MRSLHLFEMFRLTLRLLVLSRHIIRTFLLHASIARPMGESGKLKLTGDMTELEMGIASLLSTGQVQGQRGGLRIEKVGDEYLALRSFRWVSFDYEKVVADLQIYSLFSTHLAREPGRDCPSSNTDLTASYRRSIATTITTRSTRLDRNGVRALGSKAR